MKRLLTSLTLMILVLGACAPNARPTEPQSIIVEQPTKVRVDLTPAQRIAVSTLAKNLGLTADKIKLVSTQAEDWPDACLGIAMKDIACAQVVTPGFRVTLEINGKQVEYHTNQDGSIIRPATVALTWERSGGFAGFCDSLTIYLSGEVQGSTCNNAPMREKSVAEMLTAAEITRLNGWVSKYGIINVDASDPVGVADGMALRLQLNGMGDEQTVPSATQQTMMQFAQNLYQTLMSK